MIEIQPEEGRIYLSWNDIEYPEGYDLVLETMETACAWQTKSGSIRPVILYGAGTARLHRSRSGQRPLQRRKRNLHTTAIPNGCLIVTGSRPTTLFRIENKKVGTVHAATLKLVR